MRQCQKFALRSSYSIFLVFCSNLMTLIVKPAFFGDMHQPLQPATYCASYMRYFLFVWSVNICRGAQSRVPLNIGDNVKVSGIKSSSRGTKESFSSFEVGNTIFLLFNNSGKCKVSFSNDCFLLEIFISDIFFVHVLVSIEMMKWSNQGAWSDERVATSKKIQCHSPTFSSICQKFVKIFKI